MHSGTPGGLLSLGGARTYVGPQEKGTGLLRSLQLTDQKRRQESKKYI